ncbi:glycolipid ABC transporter ATP-binding protein [Calothrix sp. NIES-4071]|nr:glycolipid ABC transporter ATP-binding protein [Calothrix sp. NIES-4071]BAZ60052.1 glycolipid ABC transporter ATP-binding protein [Calothrix sp. NIES-4105]
MQTIVVKSLNHYFGKDILRKQVLSNINLEIKRGEIAVIIGQSGSGKTTLLSLIGALRSVQQGSLKIFGQEQHNASEEQMISLRRQIGYIFQSYNLLRFMTARQNVQMSVELKENISANNALLMSENILKAVGLEQHINYYPHQLSGGQKQRVAIARALVNNPKLLLADEPTAALDSKTGREVINVIQHLARNKGCTVVLVTHNHRILDIADRIFNIEDGCLQERVFV